MTEIRPDYYKSGGLEAFDVIDAFNLDFNLGNAFKYIARAGKKGKKSEDLRKALTYLKREFEKAEIDEGRMIASEVTFADEADDYEAGRQENL